MGTPSAVDPAGLGSEAMTAALLDAGRVETPAGHAALLLLAESDFSGTAAMTRYVRLYDETDPATGAPMLSAYADWGRLLEDLSELRLSGSDIKLLRLAASYGIGTPVDLSTCAGLTPVYAKAAAVAALVAAGASEVLALDLIMGTEQGAALWGQVPD